MKQKIVVIGEGAWGTALATLFIRNGYDVVLWCHEPSIADEIMKRHTNERYLPKVTLPAPLVATHDMAQAVADAAWICEVIPVQYLRSVVELVRPHITRDIPWLITSKGIEQDTLLLPAEVVADVLGYQPPYGVCMGPSFAHEVVCAQKTGMVIASHTDALQNAIAALFNNTFMNCDVSDDTIGLQMCGAFKNVVALLVGISDGAGNGANARALLVTHCFQKMCALVIAAGGKLDTAHGLGGFGDLFLTASSTQSRNYSTGKAIGAGESLQKVLARTGFTPEGVNTAQSIVDYAARYDVDLRELVDPIRF